MFIILHALKVAEKLHFSAEHTHTYTYDCLIPINTQSI